MSEGGAPFALPQILVGFFSKVLKKALDKGKMLRYNTKCTCGESCLCTQNHIGKNNSEKYSRGRRGAPAKGVGRETGARVQIPLSPLFQKKILKKLEKSC